MNTAAVFIYLVVWVTITYLIYRYSRYSPWYSNPGGKSVMIVKGALWLLVTYALAVSLGMDGAVQEIFRWTMVGAIEVALLHQVHTIVQLQGGWYRRHGTDERDRRRVYERGELLRVRRNARLPKKRQ